MDKIKKSITLTKPIAQMLVALSNTLGITENAVISVALLEHYNKVKNSL